MFKPAVAIVVLSLLLKVIGVAALLTAEGYDRVAGYEGTYGAAFFVAAYWGIVELIVAAPTLFAAVVLLRNLIAGNRRLSWLAIPALLLNAPVWILILMTFS